MKYLFSIIIPAHNAQKTIGTLLRRLKVSSKYSIEIIIIDSGSTDKSPDIIRSFKRTMHNLRIVNILKNEFNHGETRNYGVKLAQGKYVCFLSQDVLPLDTDFLKYFKKDLESNRDVVAVFGKQIPYPDTPLIQKIEQICNWNKFDKYLNQDGIIIQNIKKPFISYNENTKFLWYSISDAFSCYKRSFLRKNPLPKISYGEDIWMGKKIIELGLTKIYDTRAKVLHSHYYSLIQYYQQQVYDFKSKFKVLNLKKKTNLTCKVKIILNLNKGFFIKIYALFELFLYYLIKLIVIVMIRINTK